MSEIRLVILEAGGEWSGTVHASSADRAIAAVSADPTTLVELEAAYARFARPNPNRSFLANLSPGVCDEPHDAGIVVIDLVARLLVVDSTYSAPGTTGTVCYHDGQRATATWLRYHLADDWWLIDDRHQWQAVAETRRREAAGRPLPQAREIFYGRRLLEFVAREAFVAFHQQRTTHASGTDEPPGSSVRWADEDAAYDTLKQIHAAWLLTPRNDLGGACPRDVALDGRDHLARDMQDQCERWSLLGECPPGLDASSFAFCHGGLGTHELVEYYSLVRELLWSCWQRLAALRNSQAVPSGAETPAVGDFLTVEVPRLERVRDQWLETPDPELHGRTPRSIIDRERARLPELVSAGEALIDPDCPCCQMLAETPGPVFWHLDGSEMDDEFAFEIFHRTREEWEAERGRWEEFAKG